MLRKWLGILNKHRQCNRTHAFLKPIETTQGYKLHVKLQGIPRIMLRSHLCCVPLNVMSIAYVHVIYIIRYMIYSPIRPSDLKSILFECHQTLHNTLHSREGCTTLRRPICHLIRPFEKSSPCSTVTADFSRTRSHLVDNRMGSKWLKTKAIRLCMSYCDGI